MYVSIAMLQIFPPNHYQAFNFFCGIFGYVRFCLYAANLQIVSFGGFWISCHANPGQSKILPSPKLSKSIICISLCYIHFLILFAFIQLEPFVCDMRKGSDLIFHQMCSQLSYLVNNSFFLFFMKCHFKKSSLGSVFPLLAGKSATSSSKFTFHQLNKLSK